MGTLGINLWEVQALSQLRKCLRVDEVGSGKRPALFLVGWATRDSEKLRTLFLGTYGKTPTRRSILVDFCAYFGVLTCVSNDMYM